MAARLVVDHQRLQQFITSSPWDVGPVRRTLARLAIESTNKRPGSIGQLAWGDHAAGVEPPPAGVIMNRRRTVGTLAAGLLLLVGACSNGSSAAEVTTSASVTGSSEMPSSSVSASAGPENGASDAGAVGAVVTPIVGAVPFAPVPVLGDDGRTHLVYEISLINYTNQPVTVDEVKVVDPATGQSIFTLAGTDLADRLKPTGGGNEYSEVLQAGQNGMLFLHVPLDEGTPVPASLTHELTATIGGTAVTEQLAATTVDARTLPVLGPPLAGEGYIAADGCCDAVRHTRAVLPLNGTPLLAQRFAIDYEQVGPDDLIYVGDKSDVNSYRIYGDNALAVADGVVVGTHDGLPEQTPGVYPEGIPIGEADGNFVVLDIGNGFFVNYAHLQPGSVRVEPGQRVSKGDVLGLVGNTGNSVAPHLHLHVMDTASPVVSQGLPYLVDSFTVTARSASTAAFDDAEGNGVPLQTVPGLEPTEHENQLPLDQGVLTFSP
jgi:hypothetical protein